MIEFRNVKKTYTNNENPAIREASFKLESGEFVFFMGESGAGKSTLLKMIYKDEMPTSGDLMVFGKNTKKTKSKYLRRNIGVVFQDFKLLPNKTAYENVAYVLESFGKNVREVKKRTNQILEELGLGQKKKSYPSEMSGGEQQRVAIARAMVYEPSVLICDEPTGNLDDNNSKIVMDYLRSLNHKGVTILMATHDKNIVRQLKKRVVYVEKGMVEDNHERNAIDLSSYISEVKAEAE